MPFRCILTWLVLPNAFFVIFITPHSPRVKYCEQDLRIRRLARSKFWSVASSTDSNHGIGVCNKYFDASKCSCWQAFLISAYKPKSRYIRGIFFVPIKFPDRIWLAHSSVLAEDGGWEIAFCRCFFGGMRVFKAQLCGSLWIANCCRFAAF